jgi:hypothetical protein
MDKSKLKNKIKEVEECMEQMTLEHEVIRLMNFEHPSKNRRKGSSRRRFRT